MTRPARVVGASVAGALSAPPLPSMLLLVLLALVAASSLAPTASAALVASSTSCGSQVYSLIQTRGTGETQGPSVGFVDMFKYIQGNVSQTGTDYNTVYPAAQDQQSASGTQDIINQINSTLAVCPDHKFALFGYSQGATATTVALGSLSGSVADAIVAVILLGNPMHQPGKQSNRDINGGNATANTHGLLALLGGLPDAWDRSGKVIDWCASGDGVCDVEHGVGITVQHTSYPGSAYVQGTSANFVAQRLRAALPSASSTGGANQNAATRGSPASAASVSACCFLVGSLAFASTLFL